jgi:hypothetical protein
MVKRGTKAAIAALAALGGAVTGSHLYLRYLANREDNLRVTVYSEPHYRGLRRTLTLARIPQGVCSLSDTGLPRIGSIRLERVSDAVRPALLNVVAGWSWVRSSAIAVISREFDEALESSQTAVNLLADALNPEGWRLERGLGGDLRSSVRLWADRPTYPAPPVDDEAGSDGQPWYDVLTDTPDLGPWSARLRYLQLGVHRT